MTADVLERVRSACARVSEQADQVRIDEARLEVFAAELAEVSVAPDDDPAHLRLGDPEATLAYVVTLDALNFGSGWFPHLEKRPGLSGYFTIALGLREHFEERGPWSARELVELRPEDCTAVFGQRAGAPEVAELMALFARALGDLGRWLLVGHGGRVEGPVEAAGGRAGKIPTALDRASVS